MLRFCNSAVVCSSDKKKCNPVDCRLLIKISKIYMGINSIFNLSSGKLFCTLWLGKGVGWDLFPPAF